jgi:acetate kinase
MAPQILVINSGSSSLKFSIFDLETERQTAKGIAERLGTEEALLKLSDLHGKNREQAIARSDHRSALLRIIEELNSGGELRVDAIGHRVVHGGEYFREATLVDREVLAKIAALSELAPLHNPPAAEGIRVVTELFPGKPQVVVFDTAFHQTLPAHAFHYAIPFELYEKYRVRRYGFHGTSHHFVGMEAAKRLGLSFSNAQLLTAHLGNGCSACAIRNGHSVDTTMGLTPLEGVMMGTRSGDVDPSLHLFLQEKEGLQLAAITDLLTKKSGLLGVSGISHDMRPVIEAAETGHQRARLAVDLFCYRLARALLGLAAALNRIDALIFTGGIGENSPLIRRQAVEHLAILPIEIDHQLNKAHGAGNGGRISSGPIACLVVPTNEELMIVRQTAAVALGEGPGVRGRGSDEA